MNDIGLQHYIRVYDGDLAAPFCAQMIQSFEQLPRFHQPNGRGHRAGLEESRWTELNVTRMSDAAFLGFFRTKIDAALSRYNEEVGLDIPVPNSPKTAELILKRYRPGGGEAFQPHFDALYEHSNRYLVFIWYLNDVAEGGETTFPKLGVSVQPRTGRLLMFPPYWMYQHAGLPPVSGNKFIVSTYLLF